MFNELCMHALRRRRLLRNIHSHKRRRDLEATFCITTLSEITGLNLTPSVTTAAAMPFILFFGDRLSLRSYMGWHKISTSFGTK